jgi:Na+-translocating ferredoxin:NAD+ oxidoreductase RNF subunit RnfB
MLHQLLVAAGAIVGLMLAWLAVQSLKRRSDPSIAKGEDVLLCGTCGANSCGGCLLSHADSPSGRRVKG